MAAVPRSVGRPRDDNIDDAVLDAAITELATRGFQNFSVQRVAKEAGVARATVYLRWPERDSLITDALRRTERRIHVPDTGTLQGDLRVLAHDWAEVFNDSRLSSVFAHVLAEGEMFPEVVKEYKNKAALPANRTVEQVLRRARQRGELRADVELRTVARCLVGALWLESTLTDRPLSAGFERSVVGLLLHALAPHRN
ncbi:TetR/AcrR family transcriptional regulator [Gordonia terrae]|uniref:TetR/AcrR family transcriptional regulator n=1 Tax=Gordonia terrae TaxID=2055 RepID=UPI003F6A9CF1